MRVFVGTLYCGEADFAVHIDAITHQVGVDITHFVVDNKPEYEAHSTLWKKWNEVKSEFDLFIKVDADTVLINNTTVSEICKVFAADRDVTGLQAPLHDYFTDSLINGLNCFSPVVSFRDGKDELYCDRNVDFGHKKTVSSERVPNSLRPAGLHCHYANDRQAFHFGLHRALKNQNENMRKVALAYNKHGDRLRKLALLGAEAAIDFRCDSSFNYCDEKFNEHFSTALRKL